MFSDNGVPFAMLNGVQSDVSATLSYAPSDASQTSAPTSWVVVIPPGMNPAAQAAKQLADNMSRNGAYPGKTPPRPLLPGPDFRQIPPTYKPMPWWVRLLKLIGGGLQNVSTGSTEVVLPVVIMPDPCVLNPSLLQSCGGGSNGPS